MGHLKEWHSVDKTVVLLMLQPEEGCLDCCGRTLLVVWLVQWMAVSRYVVEY